MKIVVMSYSSCIIDVIETDMKLESEDDVLEFLESQGYREKNIAYMAIPSGTLVPVYKHNDIIIDL